MRNELSAQLLDLIDVLEQEHGSHPLGRAALVIGGPNKWTRSLAKLTRPS